MKRRGLKAPPKLTFQGRCDLLRRHIKGVLKAQIYYHFSVRIHIGLVLFSQNLSYYGGHGLDLFFLKAP
jgi:hypothetical protein